MLALRGAHVIIGARKLDAAKDAKKRLLEGNPTARVDVLKLDLCSISSVREFVDDFKALNLPLNILM